MIGYLTRVFFPAIMMPPAESRSSEWPNAARVLRRSVFTANVFSKGFQTMSFPFCFSADTPLNHSRFLRHRMTSRWTKALLAIAACSWSFAALMAAESGRPNIVIFLSDDQGWGDLSVHGNTNLSTPSIDSLARDGALFERF